MIDELWDYPPSQTSCFELLFTPIKLYTHFTVMRDVPFIFGTGVITRNSQFYVINLVF